MDDERLARLEQRLEELDRRSTAMERAMDQASTARARRSTMICRSETRKHLRAAGREQLLAVRSLLDFWVDQLGDEPETTTANPRENIPID